MAAALSYIILVPFRSYQVGQVYQIDPAVVALYPSSDVALVNQTVVAGGGGGSTTGTSTSGTTTMPTGGTGSSGSSGSLTVGHAADGNLTLTDALGNVYELTSLSASQLAALMGAVQSGQILDAQGHLAVALGSVDVSAGTVAGMTVANAVSTLGSHSAHLLNLDTGLAAINTAESTVGTTVAAHTALLGTHTAQLGTLASGVSSAGSAASAAGTIAMAAQSAVGSLGSTVSNLGTQVAQAKPITGNSNDGTFITLLSGSTALTKFAGIPGTPGVQGPAGTLGSGEVSANVAATALGGPTRSLARQRGERVNVIDFGASPNSTPLVSDPVANGGLNCHSRADLVAYRNSAGAATYAALATAPISTGGGSWFRLPLPVTSKAGGSSVVANPVIPVTTAFTLRGAAYYDENGWLYLPVNNAPDANTNPVGDSGGVHPIFNFYEDWTVTGGGLPSGSFIWSVIENELCLGPMPSGISIAAGTVLQCGADITKFSAGMGFWGPYGISDLNTIVSVNASAGTVTLAKPLTTGTLPYGFNYDGVGQFEQCWLYNPITDAQISSSLWMNVVAIIAAYYNTQQPYSNDEVYFPSGDYYLSHGFVLAGRAVNFSGAGKHQVYLRGVTDDVALKVFPPADTITHYRDLEFYSQTPQGGNLPSFGISVDGQAYPVPQTPVPSPNVNFSTATFENIYSVGGYLSLIDCQQMGDMRFEHVGGQGPGKNDARVTATVRTIRCTEYKAYDVGSTNQSATFLQVGYVEHPAIIVTGQNQCLRGYDGRRASRYNGIGTLLFTLVGGDGDIFYSGIHIRFAENFSIGPANVSMPIYVADNGQRPVNAGITLDCCHNFCLTGLNGGTGTNPSTGAAGAQDMVQLNRAMVNGSYQGCDDGTIRGVNGTGWKSAVRIGAGCNNMDVDARLYDPGQPYGFSVNSVIDETNGTGNNLIRGASSGSGNTTSTAAVVLNTAMNLAASQTINSAVSVIAMAVNDDPTGAVSGNSIVCPVNGVYDAYGWIEAAVSNSSQSVGGATVTSSPAGTQVQMQVYGQLPGLSAPAGIYDTLPDGGVMIFSKRFYAPAGSKIGMSGYAVTPTVIIAGGMSVKFVHATS